MTKKPDLYGQTLPAALSRLGLHSEQVVAVVNLLTEHAHAMRSADLADYADAAGKAAGVSVIKWRAFKWPLRRVWWPLVRHSQAGLSRAGKTLKTLLRAS